MAYAGVASLHCIAWRRPWHIFSASAGWGASSHKSWCIIFFPACELGEIWFPAANRGGDTPPPSQPHPVAQIVRAPDPSVTKGANAGDLGALQAFYTARTGGPLWTTEMGFSEFRTTSSQFWFRTPQRFTGRPPTLALTVWLAAIPMAIFAFQAARPSPASSSVVPVRFNCPPKIPLHHFRSAAWVTAHVSRGDRECAVWITPWRGRVRRYKKWS